MSLIISGKDPNTGQHRNAQSGEDIVDSGGNNLKTRVDPAAMGGRLSLSPTEPVPTTDQIAGTDPSTIYLLPYTSQLIALYDGTNWEYFDIGSSGVNLSLSGLSADTNYDIFLYDSNGLVLESIAWSDDTNRATSIVRQDGAWVKNGATSRRYVGTIRTTGTIGQCEDSAQRRFVWNVANRVRRADYATETINSWTESGDGTWSSMASAGTTAVWERSFVRGLDEDAVIAHTVVFVGTPPAGAHIHAIAPDWTSGAPTRADAPWGRANGSDNPGSTHYAGLPGIGLHTLTAVETTNTADTQTVLGDNGTGFLQSGMTVTTWR